MAEESIEVWTEKYRPQQLKQIVDQRHIIERLEAFVAKKNIPHMLFAGPAGCGKTTAAICIAKELYGKNWRQNYLEFNASDERGIDVIRYKVKDFARTKAIAAPYKICVLDEADALTAEAQQALRRTMENYSATCRFILICNYSSRIIEPIQSRCAVFRFKALYKQDVTRALQEIARKEKLRTEESVFDSIFNLSEGDLRKAINFLQAAAAMDMKITDKVIYAVTAQTQSSVVKEMLAFALAGKFTDARKILLDLLFKQGFSGEDIIKEISRQIYDLDTPEKAKIAMIEKVGEFEFRLGQGGNEQIQLEALLAQFALYGK